MNERPAQDRRIPDAQAAVLGSMLIDERTVPILMRQLRPEHFPDQSLRHVFEAVRRLWSEQKPVDAVTVREAMGGGAEYGRLLLELMDVTPTSANCEAHAAILRQHHELEAIRAAGLSLAMDCQTLEEARQRLAEAAKLLVQDGDNLRQYSYLEMVARFLERQRDPNPRDYLDFGISAMNSRVHVGLGDFVILGAYSSVGKTAFALQLARTISGAGKRVAFYSYETNEAHVGDRMLANAATVRLQAIKQKQLTAEDFSRVIAEGSKAERYDFLLVESARMRPEDLRAHILAHGIQVAFVDYVQLIPGDRRTEDRKDTVAAASMELHRICQELGVTIIALSQVTLPELSKKGDRRWITMQDLRESKQLLQDAETILLMDLEFPKVRSSDRVLIIDKNKDGPVGHFFLRFDPAYMKFYYREQGSEPVEKEEPPEPEYRQGTFEDLDEAGEIPF